MRMFVTWCVSLVVLVATSAPGAPREPAGAADSPQVIKLTAKKYDFEPSTITVTRGVPVRIEATALDRDHGIEIEEFGVKQKLEKGKMTVVEFTPDKAGEYTVHCSVFCGFGHHGMKAKLVVVEPKS
jgi:cytochrome c oxidase subunit 2